MVDLNLDRINSHSPHVVTASEGSMSFQFVTDFGVTYNVSFLEDELMLSDESYQFIIANTNNKKSPRDSKMKQTIMAIVYEFFECSNTTLLYICETGDSKQEMRNRLFEIWFNSSLRKSDFVFMSADIRDAEGIPNYAAIVVRLDNPRLTSVIAEFTETVQLLSQKPE